MDYPWSIIPLCAPQAKEGEEGEGEGAEEKPPVTPVGAPKGKKPANQFNYSERASQTYNNPLRVSVGEQWLYNSLRVNLGRSQ